MDGLPGAGFLESGPASGASEPQPSGEVLIALLDHLACGVMVLALDGRVVHTNQIARSELARAGLWQSGQPRLASTPEQLKVMQGLLTNAATGARGLVTLSSDVGKLTVAVVPLKVEPSLPLQFALVFSRAVVFDLELLGFFARRHCLTATEEQVLGILCQGSSAPDVARQMKLAVSTIRTHVRSICAKTRSSGIRELVNRVALLPPITSGLPAGSGQDQVH